MLFSGHCCGQASMNRKIEQGHLQYLIGTHCGIAQEPDHSYCHKDYNNLGKNYTIHSMDQFFYTFLIKVMRQIIFLPQCTHSKVNAWTRHHWDFQTALFCNHEPLLVDYHENLI